MYSYYLRLSDFRYSGGRHFEKVDIIQPRITSVISDEYCSKISSFGFEPVMAAS